VSVVANVAINVDSTNAVSKLRQVQTQAQSTEKAFGALQSAIGALGVGFALTKVIADVKELDTNLRRLGTVGVDVAKISPALSKLSDELGGVASKAELAAASYQAASAGFSDTAGNINILRAATKAATGGLADTQAVTEVLVKTLNSYGMSGDQAIQVTDSISKAVELGNQEWSDYTSQLGRVASIAAIAGVSLDEVNAFIAAATKNGATAEIAFTGLSATLNTLLQPTKESQEAAAKLGIAWNYGGLQAKGFTGLMAELAVAIDKDKEASSRLLGTQEAMRGAFAAASKDGSDFKNILEQIGGAAGKTDADFQTMKGSLENTLKALDTSFKNLSEALGIAFGPTVVIAVQDVTKAVNGFANFMAEVPQPVMDGAGALIKLIAQMLLLQKAIQAIIGLKTVFIAAQASMTGATVASGAAATTSAGAFALYTNNTRALQAQAATATPVLNGLLGTLGRLAAIGAIAIVVNVAVTGMAALLQASAEIARLRGQRNQAGGAAADFGGSITPQQRKENEKTLAAIKKERESPGFKGQQASAALGIGKTAYNSRVAQLQEREIAARARLALPTATPPAAPTTPTTATVPTAGGDAAGGKKKGKTDAEREAERAEKEAAREAQRVADVVRDQQFITKQKGIQTKFAQLISEAEQAADPIRVRQLQTVEALVLAGNETAKLLEEEKNSVAQLAIARTRQGEAEAIRQEGTQDVLKLQLEQKKNFDEIIAGLDLELALKSATTEQAREQLRLAYELAKLQGQGFTPEQIGAIAAKKTELAAPKTDQQNITEKIGKLKKEVAELTNIGNIAITVADGIGVAFSQAFQGLISGSMSAEEALGSFFKSVGDMFVSMAAEIIAKQMTMIILQTILKALGAVGGGGGGGGFSGNAAGFGGSFDAGIPSIGNTTSFAGVFGRAGGGPAAGGTPYLVGERGPELFVPGSNGGVMSNNDLRSAMNGQGGGAAGSPVLNMSFESTNIGGVEYVSRDQLEQAMAETRRNASRDGAQRGMTMTLDRIQNSSSTRRRIGV
jgi:TP901 family phage tail tape measure protein